LLSNKVIAAGNVVRSIPSQAAEGVIMLLVWVYVSKVSFHCLICISPTPTETVPIATLIHHLNLFYELSNDSFWSFLFWYSFARAPCLGSKSLSHVWFAGVLKALIKSAWFSFLYYMFSFQIRMVLFLDLSL
jgi:hypothetical protein